MFLFQFLAAAAADVSVNGPESICVFDPFHMKIRWDDDDRGWIDVVHNGSVLVRLEPPSDDFVLRFSGPGAVQAFFSNMHEKRVVYTGAVTRCEDFILANSDDALSSLVQQPRPHAELIEAGFLALDGKNSFVIPNEDVPPNFTVSFWLFRGCASEPKHVALMYKGLGGGQRTPSAWFETGNDKVLSRVSTVNSEDEGASSIGIVPCKTWTHLSFSYVNSTAPCQGSSSNSTCPKFVEKLYIDGEIDSTITFNVPVLGNQGNLHIGGAPRTPGVQGFIGGISIHNRPLADDELSREMLASKSQLRCVCVNPQVCCVE